jgi:hypothetical protein
MLDFLTCASHFSIEREIERGITNYGSYLLQVQISASVRSTTTNPIITTMSTPESSSTPPQASSPETPGPTALQLTIMAVVLGSSAGLTLYTKKTGSMLRGLKTMEEGRLRRNPPKIGPPTKEMWEKTRPRIDKDEFF